MMESPIPLYFSQKHSYSTGIILHGFLGNHKSMEELATYLDSSYILPDLIGHGRSPCPKELKQYTLEAMINQLHEVTNSSLRDPF
ncbi:MAG: alpha/beta fold hydrolase, partial [Actinomycetota bacterium]|nr:alpha/beta fold hydrolase [Actinomycetota bacterium]